MSSTWHTRNIYIYKNRLCIDWNVQNPLKNSVGDLQLKYWSRSDIWYVEAIQFTLTHGNGLWYIDGPFNFDCQHDDRHGNHRFRWQHPPGNLEAHISPSVQHTWYHRRTSGFSEDTVPTSALVTTWQLGGTIQWVDSVRNEKRLSCPKQTAILFSSLVKV